MFIIYRNHFEWLIFRAVIVSENNKCGYLCALDHNYR